METNGIGKFLPALLKKELATRHIPCAVLEKTSHQNKVGRILTAFDAILMNRALKAHNRIKQTPFLEQMQEWKPAGSSKDDALDAVAGCLLNEPVKISSHRFFNTRKEWRF